MDNVLYLNNWQNNYTEFMVKSYIFTKIDLF